MTDIDKDLMTFGEHVPFGEEAFMVLKAQLLVEYSLARYIAARVPSLLSEIEDRNSPVRSGLALILLAQSLSLRDEIPPTCSDKLWPALKKLNSLRNDLAHNLYPKKDRVINLMREFVKIITDEPIGTNENLNRLFYMSARTVVGYLAIDRNPLTLSDVG